jgi:hypothetical protein
MVEKGAKIYTIYHGGNPPHVQKIDYIPLNADRNDLDNISDRLSFSEMRGHYWIWKNSDLDYLSHIGFQHYRRWLWLESRNTLIPYVDDTGEFISYTNKAQAVPSWVYDFDFIVARAWEFKNPIGTAYANTHTGRDWEILLDECTDFRRLAAEEFSYNVCSMFLTKVSHFYRYMTFWWDLCQRIEPQITIPSSGYASRSMAFLSERIFSLWLKRERSRDSSLRVIEVPMLMNLSVKIPDSR